MIPPIPPDVPLCHKNYEESLNKLKRVINNHTNYEDLDFYQYCQEENKRPDWYTLESFYKKTIDTKNKNREEEDGIEKLLGDGDGKGPSTEIGRVRVRNYDMDEIADEYGEDFDYEVADRDNKLWQIIYNIHKIIDESFIDKRSNKKEEDIESEEIDIVDLTNIKDIAKSNARNKLLIEELEILSYYDAIQGNLTCIKNSKPIRKALHILLDDSGSMAHPVKLLLVDEILDYCKKKLDDNTEVFIYPFEKDVHRVYNLTDSSYLYNPVGGDTRIDASIMTLFNELKENNDYDVTSVLVVNDGQDYINPEFTPPHKVSCISIGLHNDNVEEVVKRSDGIYYSIDLDTE